MVEPTALTSETLAKARVVVPEHVVYRTFEAETVLLNLETGRYHGIDGVGGRMLELLQETGSPERTASTIAHEYDRPYDQIAHDLAGFCNKLAERGLIEIDVEGH